MLKRALAGALALLCAACSPAFAAEPVDTAIVFLVDVSHSMEDDEIATAREAHASAVQSSEFLTAVHNGMIGRVAVTYIEFAGEPETIVDWMVIDGPEAAASFAQQVLDRPVASRSSTGIGLALLYANWRLTASPYEATKEVIDLVGDGRSNFGMPPEEALQYVLERDVTVNTMPLMLRPEVDLDAYYADLAAGFGAFTMPVDDISQMPMALRQKIILELF